MPGWDRGGGSPWRGGRPGSVPEQLTPGKWGSRLQPSGPPPSVHSTCRRQRPRPCSSSRYYQWYQQYNYTYPLPSYYYPVVSAQRGRAPGQLMDGPQQGRLREGPPRLQGLQRYTPEPTPAPHSLPSSLSLAPLQRAPWRQASLGLAGPLPHPAGHLASLLAFLLAHWGMVLGVYS